MSPTLPHKVQHCIEIVMSVPIIIFNGMFMIALVKKKTLHNPSNAALGCLCCSDLLTGLFSFLLMVPTFFWIFGSSSDWFYAYSIVFEARAVFCFLSMVFIMFVNIDRYAAICHPFKYLQYATPKLYAVIAISTCLFAIVQGSAVIVAYTIYRERSIYWVSIVNLVAIAVVLVYCNLRIIKVTQRHSREIASSENLDVEHHRRYQNEKRRYRIVVLLVAIFVLCKLPNVIYVFLIFLVKMKRTVPFSMFNLASNTIFLFDSLINPIAYYFRLKVFRTALKAVFCSQRQV